MDLGTNDNGVIAPLSPAVSAPACGDDRAREDEAEPDQ